MSYGSLFSKNVIPIQTTEDSNVSKAEKGELSVDSLVLSQLNNDTRLDSQISQNVENRNTYDDECHPNQDNEDYREVNDLNSRNINNKLTDYIDEGIDYSYRKNITIDHDMVDEALTNFPVLIDIFDSDLRESVQNEGYDIIFTDIITGNKLNHEVEFFDRKYNSSHSRLTAWINVPALSSENDTVIVMNYGNETVDNQENPAAVWDSEFKGVWHLSESPTGAIDEIIDSTSSNNHGTTYDMDSEDQISGKIDGNVNFNGVSYINCGNDTNLHANSFITLSAWVNPSTLSKYDKIIVKPFGNNPPYMEYSLCLSNNANSFWFELTTSGSVDQVESITIPSTENWYHVVGVYNGSMMKIYVNGEMETTLPKSGTISDYGRDLRIGINEYNSNEAWNGTIDEARISSVARSDSWIATEYNNQYDPSSFYTIGPMYLSVYESENYIYSKNITINSTNIDDTLIDFPFLIDIYDSNLHNNVQSDGDDIIFTDVTGEKLDHDIEIFNQTFNDSYAHLVAWVKIPEISSSDDTNITMWYGNSTRTNQENPTDVWEDYTAVWHLGEDVVDEETISNSHEDVTSNGYEGDQDGNNQVEGLIEYAQEFDGNDEINIGSGKSLDPGGDVWLSVWFKLEDDFTNSSSTSLLLLSKYLSYDNNLHVILSGTDYNSYAAVTKGSLVIKCESGNVIYKWSNKTSWLADKWYHLSIFIDSSDNSNIKIYINGIDDTSPDNVGNIGGFELTFTGEWGIGGGGMDSFNYPAGHAWFDGIIDEVRITTADLSAIRVSAEFLNLNNPDLFYSIGDQFSLDLNPPEVVEFGVDDLGEGNPVFWAVIEDDNSGVANVTLKLNSTEHEMSLSESDYWTFVPQGVNYGDYFTYSIKNASDNYGRFMEASSEDKTIKFDHDTVEPYVDDQDYFTDTGIFNANVSDAWGIIDTVIVNVTSRGGITSIMRNTTGGYINDTLEMFEGTIYFVITVNDTKGNSFTSIEHPDYSSGVKPVVTNLTLMQDNVTLHSNESLELSYSYFDADFDEELGTEIRWYNNSILQPDFNNTLTIPASYLIKDDFWYVTVMPRDGVKFGILKTSLTIKVMNTVPEITNYEVNPINPTNTSDLSINVNYFDNDADSLEFIIEWFRNGVIKSNLHNKTIVEATNTTRGEEWSFRIRAHDEVNYSLWYQSENVTVINSAPILSSTPTFDKVDGVDQNDDLNIVYTYYDADNDEEDNSNGLYVRWYKWDNINGVEYQSQKNNDTLLHKTETEIEEVWFYIIRVYDGYEYSIEFESEHVAIDFTNSSPEARFLNLTTLDDLNLTISDLFANYTFYDPDTGQTESGTIVVWYLNRSGVVILVHEFNGSLIIDASATLKGDQWWFAVQPKDGLDYGIWVNSTAILIQNSSPKAIDLMVNNNPYNTTDLVATWIFSDNDTEDVNNYDINSDFSIIWYRNDELQHHLNGSRMVEASNTSKGENWHFVIIVFDGTTWSIPFESEDTTILNSLPLVSELTITEIAYNLTDLLADWSFIDDDNDNLEGWNLIWYKNGEDQAHLNNVKIVNAGNTTRGEYWWYTLRVFDGENWSIANYTSPAISIANTIPSIIGQVEINSSTFKTGSDLSLEYNFTDADKDPESGTIITWYKNGIIQLQLSGLTIISGEEIYKEDTWMARIRVRDLYGAYGDWYNSSEVTIENSIPDIRDIDWNLLLLTTNEDLILNYDYYDVDGDSEKQTLIRWFINGTEIVSNTNLTVLQSSLFFKGDNIYVIITPFDGESYGFHYNSTDFSGLVNIINSIPAAIDNAIENGTDLRTTDDLVANWTFHDDDPDDSQSWYIIRWYKFIGTRYEEITELFNCTVISSGNITKGDSWFYEITVSDGDNASIFYQSEPVLILNTRIVINSVNLAVNGEDIVSTDIFTNYNLLIDFNDLLNYIDSDDDDIEDFIVFWYVNGLLRTDLTNLAVIPSAQLYKGDIWFCNVSIIDNGDQWSNFVTSRMITVRNSLPAVTSIEFVFSGNVREFIISDEMINISYSFNDLDSDSDQSIIYWYHQGESGPVSIYTNMLSLPANATAPGDLWWVVIIPYDGEEFGFQIISINITIESRPVIVNFGPGPQTSVEGYYHPWVEAVDERNDIYQVQFDITINWLNITKTYYRSDTNGTPNIWSADELELIDLLKETLLSEEDFVKLLGTNITVQMTVKTKVFYSGEYYDIQSSAIYFFVIEDNAPPRIIAENTGFYWNDDNRPTNITFYTQVLDYGSDIGGVFLLYQIRDAGESNVTSTNMIRNNYYKRSKFYQDTSGFNRTEMFFNGTHYVYTLDYTPKTDTEVYFTIQVSDTFGNSNNNGFPLGMTREYVDVHVFDYIVPGLNIIEIIPFLIAFIVIVSAIAFVAIRTLSTTEIVGLDIEKVMEKTKKIDEEAIKIALNDHTLGIVISIFDQWHGPIPTYVEPAILRDNFDKLVELSDRSFSATRFVSNFNEEKSSNFEFDLSHEFSTSLLSFGFSLERPEKRGGAENITLNILIHKKYDTLVSQFIDQYNEIIHEIHVTMDKQPSEKGKVALKVKELRKKITSIILAYEEIRGSIVDDEGIESLSSIDEPLEEESSEN